MTGKAADIFYGDGREGENSHDFLRAFRREMRNLSLTDDKNVALAFVDYLSAGSMADKWYDDLAQATKDSWNILQAEFAARWPTVMQASRTEQEIERELLGTLLKEKELGEKVKTGGVEVHSHIAWADRITVLVNEANLASKTTHIWQVRDKLPDTLKEVIKGNHANWTAFCQAVRDVDLQHICDAVDRRKKREEEQREVDKRLRLLEAAQGSPTAAIRTQFSRASITQQQAQPVPQFSTTARATNNTFTSQAGGRGNLVFGTRTNVQNTRAPMTTTQTEALHARVNALPQHSNTEAGRVAYRKQLDDWNARYGPQTRVTEETPYPLRPGTAPVCTGECWNCGTNGHRRDQCPVPIGSEARISQKEAAWRRICTMALGLINRANATPVQLVIINQYQTRPMRAEEPGAGDETDQGNGEGSPV